LAAAQQFECDLSGFGVFDRKRPFAVDYGDQQTMISEVWRDVEDSAAERGIRHKRSLRVASRSYQVCSCAVFLHCAQCGAATSVDAGSRYSYSMEVPMPATARAKEKPPKMPPKTEGESLSLEERIRRRAYELYVDCGSESGSELEDWLRAEEEIRSTVEQEQEAKFA
jgi:hypothetical protein